jgi:transcriptional regulator with XRE-family HTH domain
MSEKQSDNLLKIIELNIRQQTKARGMTLAELSQHIKMTEAGFYKMLSSESIKLKTLKKIADVLLQPIEFFLTEQKPEKRKASYQTEEQSFEVAEPTSGYQREKENLLKQISLLESQLKDKEKIIELLSNRS